MNYITVASQPCPFLVIDPAGSDLDPGQQANLRLDPDLPHHYRLAW